MTRNLRRMGDRASLALGLLFLSLAGPGCSDTMDTGELTMGAANPGAARQMADTEPAGQDQVQTPSEIVSVEWAGETLRFWPYTGPDLSAQPSDPVNLIFLGPVDPVGLRAALLALDGNRAAFGFPDVAPFNARWTDAIGDVHAAYSEGAEWSGSEVQLALGDYTEARFHVRFFRTGREASEGREWTLGAAHFEVRIPGTADHQVLSWERAEEIVVADLVRSGLLATGPTAAGPYHPSGGFRAIPPFLYNELPAPLRDYIGGPSGPVTDPVPIGTDGNASLLVLGTRPPFVADTRSQNLTIQFDQVIPKPFCSDGPADWLLASGPIELRKTVQAGEDGSYRTESRITGRLQVVPVDITHTPPVPIGEPYTAEIGDHQVGMGRPGQGWIESRARRIGLVPGGSELQQTHLRVSTNGSPISRVVSRCPSA